MSTTPLPPSPKHLDQGGLRLLAEYLLRKHGAEITCPQCRRSEPPPWKAYNLDEGGKGANGLKRRQFRCRLSAKANGSCPVKSCRAYIDRAAVVIGQNLVEQARVKVHKVLSGTQGFEFENISQPLVFPLPPTITYGGLHTTKEQQPTPRTHETTETKDQAPVVKDRTTPPQALLKEKKGVKRAGTDDLSAAEPITQRRRVQDEPLSAPRREGVIHTKGTVPHWAAELLSTDLEDNIYTAWQQSNAVNEFLQDCLSIILTKPPTPLRATAPPKPISAVPSPKPRATVIPNSQSSSTPVLPCIGSDDDIVDLERLLDSPISISSDTVVVARRR